MDFAFAKIIMLIFNVNVKRFANAWKMQQCMLSCWHEPWSLARKQKSTQKF